MNLGLMKRPQPKIISSRKLPNPDLDPADRQKRLSGWNQEKIRQSSALVAGAGALGNEVIKNLIQLGVGKIYVVDFDEVVPANLNRCILFRPDDAKRRRKKVHAIAENVKEIDPYGYVEVVPIDGEIGGFEGAIKYDNPIYREADVYFGALDNMISRIHLAIASQHNGRPLIDGGMLGFIGSVRVDLPGHSSCLGCELGSELKKGLFWEEFYKSFKCDHEGWVEKGKMPSLPTTTSIVAGIMVQEYIKLIFGLEIFLKEGKWPMGEPLIGKRLFINFMTNTYRVIEVPRDPNCLICSHRAGNVEEIVVGEKDAED